ncbi:hypothetical protein DMH25_07905 [Streptomyces sp. WAC 01325]|uniref:hypothetical protein n=1 Tax=Streptomyces sp. WAC 01325 TaxID=2203202 RepID=UPI000F8857F0|nr:hypothetical protein [Streptomyces sp. WAC 01325]RSN14849.1 hypothetical protein DMH25_07905 [Streptomyces sp. WAC 01325]
MTTPACPPAAVRQPTTVQPRPDHVSELPYPIAEDYVKDWTSERALVELIANALDEDPHTQVDWNDGTLTIHDQGPGIPRTGLLLGASRKTSQQIGQFGEGKKLAALVLARDPRIGPVQFDTVGYSFTPLLKPSTYLTEVPGPDDDQQSLVLHYQYWPTDRERGTLISVPCPREVAEEAIGRVRYLNDPSYRPPQDHAEIILEGQPGRIFVGGILVSTDTRLAASYDLPLATAKGEQNRDRTIVDGAALEDPIRRALAASADPSVIARFVDRALNGPRLSTSETYFSSVRDFAVRRAFRDHARTLWNDDEVYYNAAGSAVEDELHLQGRGVTCVTSRLPRYAHGFLMHLLGVRPVREAVSHHQRQYPKTQWVRSHDVSAGRRRTLDLAGAVFRSVFGLDALGQVKIYREDEASARYCSSGIYEPASDVMGIKEGTLDDLDETLRVVFHEGGHRRAARSGSLSSSDRSEGFELAMDTMGGSLLSLLLTHEPRRLPLLDAEAWQGVPLPPGAYLADGSALNGLRQSQASISELRKAKRLEKAPEPRRLLAELATQRMTALLAERGLRSAGRAVASVAWSTAQWRVIADPHPAGYRRAYGFTCIPDYAKAVALAELLGIHAPVLYLGHIAVEGPLYNVRRGTGTSNGPWKKPLSTHMPQVIADLRALGGPYAEQADAVEAMSQGRTPYDAEGAWLRPVNELLEAEKQRLNS